MVPIRATAWELPSAAMGTQRLLRLRYDGPEGDVSLRLTLRLETPRRFQLTGADRLGRAHWALDVSGGEALWIDHDAETHCTGSPDVQLPGWADGPVRLDALPAILLGALPGGESGAGGARRLPNPDGGTRLEFEDASGQRWSASLDGREELRTWTLWQQGRPTWWWRREGAGGRLSQRDGGRQLSWEEILVEPLVEPLTPLVVPEGFMASCPKAAS
jgi:hypothetical protein